MNNIIDISKFAINGEKPVFVNKLHVNKPYTPNKKKYVKFVEQIFESGIYTNNGPLVKRLEKEISQFLNVKHCILSSNGTLALALLLIGLDIKGEVIMPSFTFVSTPHLLTLFGISPVFCDIERSTHNLNVEHCKSLLTQKTTAIIGTHLWGVACDIKPLEALAYKNNIKLIFDASHSFGCRSKKQYIGSNGDAEFFSLHATKFFHTFEGGCVTTNDTVLAKKLESVRNFGFIEFDKVSGLGLNAKMTELSAAAGLVNLESFKEILEMTQNNYLHYKVELQDIPGVSLIEYDLNENSCHYIVLTINEDEFGVKRDRLIEILHKENVIARKYFFPGCHNMQPYACSNTTSLKNTDALAKKIILLPGGTSPTKSNIVDICNLLKRIYKYSSSLSVQ